MKYKLHYYITNEDDEEVLGGSVTLPETGSFEMVELEMGKVERQFKNFLLDVERENYLKDLEAKQTEEGEGTLQDK